MALPAPVYASFLYLFVTNCPLGRETRLLYVRGKNGKWMIPGGLVDYGKSNQPFKQLEGEASLAAAEREFYEETSFLVPKGTKLIQSYNKILGDGSSVHYHVCFVPFEELQKALGNVRPSARTPARRVGDLRKLTWNRGNSTETPNHRYHVIINTSETDRVSLLEIDKLKRNRRSYGRFRKDFGGLDEVLAEWPLLEALI